MKLLISTVIFTLGLNAFAAGKDGYVYPAKQSNKCIDSTISPEDKYYIPAQAPGGKYEGECLEISQRRNFQVINDKSTSSIKIANFFHNERFWVAELPSLDKISRAVFQIEYFFPEFIAAHTQMRFDLKKGSSLKLTAQDGSKDTLALNNFIISFEAVRRVGHPSYGLIKGFKGHFTMGARIFSLQTAYKKFVVDQQHNNDQIVLDFNQDERIDLLKDLLKLGNDNTNYVEIYDTLKNNCTTKLYEAIETVRPTKKISYYSNRDGYSRKVVRKYPLEALPSYAEGYLEFKDVILTKIQPLGDEFTSIQDIYIK